jgi:muconate cycloisomerase
MQLSIEPLTLYLQPEPAHGIASVRLSDHSSKSDHSTGSVLWVKIKAEGEEGWGEACPFEIENVSQALPELREALSSLMPVLDPLSPWDRQAVDHLMNKQRIPSAARAAVDMALYDWMGKILGYPLWKIWGLDRSRIPAMTVTIDHLAPEAVQAQAQVWIQTAQAQAFKIKLGHPSGIRLDQERVIALQEVIPLGSVITAEAVGRWPLQEALIMGDWLAGQGVECIEQPLPRGQEAELVEIWHRCPLPVFIDESFFISRDLPLLVDRIRGVTIKLMKTGGLTEALRVIHTARAHDLKVMLSSFQQSTLGNTAATHLTALVDYVDLDSHLHWRNDPFKGATFKQGVLLPSDLSGLGVTV